MNFTEKVLQTKQAKEAIGGGIITWLFTGNLDNGINALIGKGNQNGTITAIKFASVLDILKAISNDLRK